MSDVGEPLLSICRCGGDQQPVLDPLAKLLALSGRGALEELGGPRALAGVPRVDELAEQHVDRLGHRPNQVSRRPRMSFTARERIAYRLSMPTPSSPAISSPGAPSSVRCSTKRPRSSPR